jgi:DNA polymerase-1
VKSDKPDNPSTGRSSEEVGAAGPERFFVVDGSALAYRSHFAFVRSSLRTRDGLPTGAVYGYCSALLRLLEEEDPRWMAVVFDSSEPTFRHALYPDYKATRQKMPPELVQQLPLMFQATQHLGIETVCIPGQEADDVIGSLVRLGQQEDWFSFIVSGDKDFMQLVGESVRMYHLGRREGTTVIGEREVKEALGVAPELVPDYLGLVGDSSDNIKGVPGVGPKRARELLARFGGLEETLRRSGEVEQPRICRALDDNRDAAALAKDLATIRTTVPLPVDTDHLARKPLDRSALFSLFQKLEFTSLLEKVAGDTRGEGAYVLVRTDAEFERLRQGLERAVAFSFDTETTSVDPMEAELLGISFSWREGEAYYVETTGAQGASWLAKLRPLLEDAGRAKGAQNAKYDCLVLQRAGIELRGLSFDTMVESYLIDPSARRHNLDSISMRYLGLRKTTLQELVGKGSQQISLATVEPERVAEYSCEDADYCLRLHTLFVPQIEVAGMDTLYRDVELPLVRVLMDMEATGVRLDVPFLQGMSALLGERLGELEREIWQLSGVTFNVNSPRQLAEVLYDRLEVHKDVGMKRVPRTKTGPSTAVGVLERLREHPVVDRVLEYRNLAKLKGTYVEALPRLVHPRTGRVHTSFNQTVTATGRLSSSEPNLQNIPIRTSLGRQIRKAFIPEDDTWSLLSVDYSQIELRLLAHLSGDSALRETFLSGEDAHRSTASRVFGVAMEDVTADLRYRAKVINFGVIYGMGPQRLARETGMSVEESERFLRDYFARYPSVEEYLHRQKAEAARTGEVRTMLGRRRLVPDIHSPNPGLRAAAERVAVNTPVQGSAADMIKVAMLRIAERLREKHLRGRMILQVHDEIVLEVPDDELEQVTGLVRTEMESAMPLDVPVRADAWAGKTWYR